jgi:hypothetical protein
MAMSVVAGRWLRSKHSLIIDARAEAKLFVTICKESLKLFFEPGRWVQNYSHAATATRHRQAFGALHWPFGFSFRARAKERGAADS